MSLRVVVERGNGFVRQACHPVEVALKGWIQRQHYVPVIERHLAPEHSEQGSTEGLHNLLLLAKGEVLGKLLDLIDVPLLGIDRCWDDDVDSVVALRWPDSKRSPVVVVDEVR